MREGAVMTLQQIEAKLKEAENHNTQLTARRTMYAERIQKEFKASSVAELEKMMADVDEQLGQKNAEYQAALDAAETEMKKAGIAC